MEIELSYKEMQGVYNCINGDKDLILDYPDLYDKLFRHYMSEMPYGTAKARDGDPDIWILNRIQSEEWFLVKKK